MSNVNFVIFEPLHWHITWANTSNHTITFGRSWSWRKFWLPSYKCSGRFVSKPTTLNKNQPQMLMESKYLIDETDQDYYPITRWIKISKIEQKQIWEEKNKNILPVLCCQFLLFLHNFTLCMVLLNKSWLLLQIISAPPWGQTCFALVATLEYKFSILQ